MSLADHVDAHARPVRALAVAGGSATWRSRAIIRSSFSSTALNDTSFRRLRMSRRRARDARALDRIDGDQDRVVRHAFLDQRRHGRIAGIAAVPIGLAVDLDRLEHGRQAGRGEQHVGRQLGVAEHARPSGAHVGRRDEELDRRRGEAREIDRARTSTLRQRIGPAEVEVVGREEARHQVEGDVGGRVIERPAAEQHVERAALQRAERGGLGNAAPEGLQRLARARGCRPWRGRRPSRRHSWRRPRCRKWPRSSSQGSSSSRSSTPQVKAPCEPPPCSARSISCDGRSLAGRGWIRGHRQRHSILARSRSCRSQGCRGRRLPRRR